MNDQEKKVIFTSLMKFMARPIQPVVGGLQNYV
jgi:hypothetical protein